MVMITDKIVVRILKDQLKSNERFHETIQKLDLERLNA